jgi:hypothetical protein
MNGQHKLKVCQVILEVRFLIRCRMYATHLDYRHRKNIHSYEDLLRDGRSVTFLVDTFAITLQEPNEEAKRLTAMMTMM